MRDVAPRGIIEPPRLSLLTAAAAAGRDDAARWENGLILPAATCGAVRLFDAGCVGGQEVPLLDNASTQRNYDPVGIESWYECSTGTSAAALEEAERLALATLEAMTPFAVERELWTGALARLAGYTNWALVANPNTATGITAQPEATDLTPAASAATGVSPLAAVGLLEEALGSIPGTGFIHANLRAAAFLATQATVEGNTLRTKLGSFIVPGTGYLTTGPDGTAAPAGTAWVYGTGRVTVRLTPGQVDTTAREALVRSTNSLKVTASRLMSATWDGCGLFAVLMTLKSD